MCLQDVLELFRGDLVTGALDKAQFGSYGLVHSVQVRGSLLHCFQPQQPSPERPTHDSCVGPASGL